jgi:poly(3-hydroxybutyrate) depolymerase
MSLPIRNIAFFVFALTAFSVRAATWDCEIKPKASDNFIKAEFRLWLDDGAPAPRALLVVLPGWQGDGRGYVTNASWQTFARKHKLGILSLKFQSEENGPAYHTVEGGSGDALFAALRKLATDSKQPAVADARLLIWGHSAGGQVAYGLGCFKPERVIGFAAIKGGYYHSKFNPRVRQIPAMFFIGERDQDFRRENITKLFEDNRGSGALWCVTTEPRAGHEVGKVNDVILPFFEACIKLRLPASASASLTSLDSAKGWTGLRDTFELKAPGASAGVARVKTVWLPDEATAKAWQSLARGS